MNRIIELAGADWRNIRRDPMLIISFIAPFFLLALVYFLFPLAEIAIQQKFSFSIQSYFSFVCIFFLPLIPMLMGMVYGFILLDERDAGLIAYLAVTPLGKSGYLFTRMAIPTVFSFLYILMFIYFSGMKIVPGNVQLILLTLVLSSEAPLVLLTLGAFASNKVEGMAISKGFGLFLTAVFIDFLVHAKWTFLLAVSPLWWIGRGFLSTGLSAWLYLAGAIVFHAGLWFFLLRKFKQSLN